MEIESALKLGYKGLKLAEALNDVNFIVAFHGAIASCFSRVGEAKKALDYHLKVLNYKLKGNDPYEISQAYYWVSADYEALNDTAKTIETAFKCMFYEKKLNENSFSSGAYLRLGVAYKFKHMPDSSHYYFLKASDLSKKYKNSKTGIVSQVYLTRSYFEKKDFLQAKKNGLKILDTLTKYGPSFQIAGLALILNKVYKIEKNYKESLKFFELYIQHRDSSSNEKNRKLAAQKEFDYNLEKKESENKLLAQQNRIQALEIKQNKYFLFGLGAILILVLITAYSLIRQNKLQAVQQKTQFEQKLLLTQMNPHFIFNSLQAIQNFMLKHNVNEAVRYLSSFASVTRNVLENSRMDLIPLSKEITLLDNYLQLQKLRFGNRFDYEIHLDEKIDASEISIPPMLSQPFIENAIEHGMHNIQ
ncbi:MAG: histidine kinase, partial [Bacteroidetes bacterium]|nr:histidine kinase [Bacteroidota bacterium]